MADLTAARPIARYGDPNSTYTAIYGPIGIAANTLIYGGAAVGTDANGNMVNVDTATCQQAVGVARRTYFNRNTDPSGGAAGAVLGEILAGAFPFFISTDGGSITNANRWQDLFFVDNQTVSLAANTALGTSRIPAGFLITVDSLGGPTNGMAWCQVGDPNPFAAPRHFAVNLTLAQIQAQTSGTAFTIITLPPAFWLQNASITNTQAFAGGGASAMTATLQGGSDAAGSIIASGTVFAANAVNAAPGSNPYPKRGGQAIKITLTETGGTLATLTAGTLTVDLIGTLFL